jgi:methyl-accepting chemotaxis protein
MPCARRHYGVGRSWSRLRARSKAHRIGPAGNPTGTDASEQIAVTAETTSTQAGAVSSAAQHVSGNVGTVPVGAQEMGEAIRHIAPKAREAANVVARTVEVAGTTNTTVAKLGTSSAEVGEVVKVIDAIAEQANCWPSTPA